MTDPRTTTRKAAVAYRTCHQYGLGGRDVMLEMLRAMISQLSLARVAHQGGKLDDMTEYNIRTIRILIGIRDSMKAVPPDDAAAHAAARTMQHLCQDMLLRLTNILRYPSPDEAFEGLVRHLIDLHRQWAEE